MHFKWLNAWSIGPLILVLFFIAPVIIVISSLFGDYSDNWVHLYDYVLFKYIKNVSTASEGCVTDSK
jgi:ABC-type Fe3+ transport system permease subunit